MRLIVDYKRVFVALPGQTEQTKSHQVTIKTTDNRVFMSSAFTFQEAMMGAVSIIQSEFVDVANAES